MMTGPYPPVGAPTWSPQRGWGPQGGPVRDAREADLAALSKVWTGALISVVGSALGVAVPLALSSSGHFTISIPASGSTLPFTATALYLVLGVALIGLALSMVSFWFYRDGFIALRGIDARFSSSPTWALLVIIGLVMVWLALVAVLVGLLQLLSCVGAGTTIPTSCVSLGVLLGGLALLFVGLVVLLIGYIGTLVAIWRLGDRYGNSLFKIGAVMLIIPFLSIVGQILILIGASSAQSQVRQRPAFAMAPSMASPPSAPPPPPPPLY